MQNLSDEELKRQDFVDNQIYDLVRRLTPSKREIDWDIEMIDDIRDTIQHWLVDKYKVVEEVEFYP
jgi:DNA polymerase sigma